MAPDGAIVRRRSGRPWGRRVYSALRTPALASRLFQALPASRLNSMTAPESAQGPLCNLRTAWLLPRGTWKLSLESAGIEVRGAVLRGAKVRCTVPDRECRILHGSLPSASARRVASEISLDWVALVPAFSSITVSLTREPVQRNVSYKEHAIPYGLERVLKV